jgi:hypothetical protein
MLQGQNVAVVKRHSRQNTMLAEMSNGRFVGGHIIKAPKWWVVAAPKRCVCLSVLNYPTLAAFRQLHLAFPARLMRQSL